MSNLSLERLLFDLGSNSGPMVGAGIVTAAGGVINAQQQGGSGPWGLNAFVMNDVAVTFSNSSIGVTQGTSPWVISGAVTCSQTTSPWVVSGTVAFSNTTIGVTQGTSPWVISGAVTCSQTTSPWVVSGNVNATVAPPSTALLASHSLVCLCVGALILVGRRSLVWVFLV